MVKKIIACLLTLTLVFTSVNLYEVQAKKIKLNKKQVLVRIGDQLKLKVKNTKKKVKWKSSDKTIATVSKKGVVKGKDVGFCTITAKAKKKKLKCKIIVADKIAKSTSAKTMAKVAKQIKSKGKYDSNSGHYQYVQRIIENNHLYIVNLKYFSKTNHLEEEIIFNDQSLTLRFRVGDKRKCEYEYGDPIVGYHVKGIWDVNKYSDGAYAISITDSNIPQEYYQTAKSQLYPYLEDAIEFFDQGMKKLKTKTYSESFGFNYPKSKYFL